MDDIEQKIKLTYETNANKTAKEVNKLDNSINNTTEAQKENTKTTKKNIQGLEDLGGGIGGAIKGMKGMIVQMWAIVSNPIGLVIAAIALALTGLFKAFTSTKAGGEKLGQVMDGLGAVFDVLRDRALKVFDVLGKLFKGDIIGAAKEYKNIFVGMGDEIAEEFNKAADAAKSMQEVADTMRDLGVSRAKLNRDLVEAKEIIESETASYEEKKKAIKQVQEAEEEQTNNELANAKKKLEAIRLQNALSDSSGDALQAEADAEAALYSIQQKSAEDRIKNIRLTKKADAAEKTRLKEITAARKEAAKERAKITEAEAAEIDRISKLRFSEEEKALRALQDLNDKTEEEKLARQKERDLEAIAKLEQQGIDVRNLLIYNDELYNTLEDELREKRAEEKAKQAEADAKKELEDKEKIAKQEAEIDRQLLAQKQAIEDAKINIAQKGISLLANVFGKNKAVQKAAIIAENAVGIGKMVIDNNRANIGALATPQAIATSGAAAAPVIALNNITTGIGIASSIAATSKALKALGGGSAGSTAQAATGSSRGGASSSPQVGFQASNENQIATSISNNTNEQMPIKAYVVTNEITTSQQAERNIKDSNSFG